MKLSFSNIAWETKDMADHLRILAEENCHLELSPSMIWPEPIHVSVPEILAYKQFIYSFGIQISSMHSLTYPRPDLHFFKSSESRKALISYVHQLGHLANLLEIPVMVFGSGKSRSIGNRDRHECFSILVDSFSQMAEYLKPLGVVLLIEPLSKLETDSINNADEAITLIKAVHHPHFALHIDLKSSFAEKEDYRHVWQDYLSYIFHCHVANPDLAPPDETCQEHFKVAPIIKNSGYNRYISIEIKRDLQDSRRVVKESIQFVKSVYL